MNNEQSNTKELAIIYYPSSRNSRKLAGIASQFARYEVSNDTFKPCKVFLDSASPESDYTLFVYFWDMVRNNSGTALLSNGRLLSKDNADYILDWIRCFSNQKYFEREKQYCHLSENLHGWGCKCLHSITRHGCFGRHKGRNWYNIGPFDGTIQYIDKQAIKDSLKNEADEKQLDLCPLFSINQAFRFVDLLPDQIDPSKETDWKYKASPIDTSKGDSIGVEPCKSGY